MEISTTDSATSILNSDEADSDSKAGNDSDEASSANLIFNSAKEEILEKLLLTELDEVITRVDGLTYAITKFARQPTAVEYLIRGLIEVVEERSDILQQLKKYGINNLLEAQRACRELIRGCDD